MESVSLRFLEHFKANLMLEKLRQQRIQGKFCDVVLVVGGKKFSAHRSVLAASSPYFESILKNHRITKEEINIRWEDAETFELFLDYIYSGIITLTDANVYNLLQLSSYFLILKLKDYCGQFLEKFTNLDNCITIRELAEKYELNQLNNSCLKMIRENIYSLVESEQFMQLTRKKVQIFITHPDTGCANLSFKQILTAISSWIHYDLKPRCLDLVKLLEIINWEDNFLNNDAFEVIDSHVLYQESKLALYIFLRTLVFNNVDIIGYSLQYEELQESYENAIEAYMRSDKSKDKSNDTSSLLIEVSIEINSDLISKNLTH